MGGLYLGPNQGVDGWDMTQETLALYKAKNGGIAPKPPKFPTAAEVRSEAAPRIARIFQDYNNLSSMVNGYEDILRRRWSKKPEPKRQELLLAACPPNMARAHRPDVSALKRRRTAEPETGAGREPFMWPFINLEDLCQSRPVLLMLNARGCHPSDAFALPDQHHNEFGLMTLSIEQPQYLEGLGMAFVGQRTPDTYGRLFTLDEQHLTATARHIPPGTGLYIMEIQEQVYSFLVHLAQAILHDIPTDPDKLLTCPVAPEPTSLSAGTQGAGVSFLSNTEFEAP
ncbi:hypothetical protein NKR19_g2428 [Coniochaeta hoffmannii]|uniref:Uncharacterized protein n=1 Tax=Coniochaeta hoffmannii TaxID=91930 RepID=A0AA38VS69_9PEZI|nr:hypothetical protein NKR19_g2428 [Coniochaeta hoffmannii]